MGRCLSILDLSSLCTGHHIKNIYLYIHICSLQLVICVMKVTKGMFHFVAITVVAQ